MRTNRSLLAMAIAVALINPTDRAEAQVPGMSLTFLQPTGTVAPNAAIDVWMRLSTTAPFYFDAGLPAQGFGLPPGALPSNGSWNGVPGPIASFSSAFLSAGADCGTFSAGCANPPYSFAFSSTQNINNQLLILPPGTFTDFLLGTLLPIPGGAPPGTYSLNYVDVHIDFNAVDANGSPLVAGVTLAATCGPPTPACGFTRDVVGTTVTPEPSSMALFAAGLMGLGALARKRRRTS